jgi:hypothetical protein
LQHRGWDVRLIGEDVPGRGASIWNAGALATSSILTMANPAIYRQLPAILAGRYPGVVLDWGSFRASCRGERVSCWPAGRRMSRHGRERFLR